MLLPVVFLTIFTIVSWGESKHQQLGMESKDIVSRVLQREDKLITFDNGRLTIFFAFLDESDTIKNVLTCSDLRNSF